MTELARVYLEMMAVAAAICACIYPRYALVCVSGWGLGTLVAYALKLWHT